MIKGKTDIIYIPFLFSETIISNSNAVEIISPKQKQYISVLFVNHNHSYHTDSL
jgi:hypothetical protein